MITSTFANANLPHWGQYYGLIHNARLRVDNVRGNAVDYTVDFDYQGEGLSKVGWERNGTAIFKKESAGWLLDADVWASNLVVAVTSRNGVRYSVHDSVSPGPRHTFETPWGRAILTSDNRNWYISYATPQPITPEGQTAGNIPPPNAPIYVPGASTDDCESVGVQGVYSDGQVLELDDGRHLRVADYDTATSSVWVAPFDGLICDGGDKFINKDDNESVDLQP